MNATNRNRRDRLFGPQGIATQVATPVRKSDRPVRKSDIVKTAALKAAPIPEFAEIAEAETTPAIAPMPVHCRGVSDSDIDLYREAVTETCGWIDDPEFAKAKADVKLFGSELDAPAARQIEDIVRPAAGFEWSPTDPLSAAQERDLFRKLNFVRYRLNRLFKRIPDMSRPKAEDLRRIAALRRLVHRLRERIVEANVALVISMAKRSRVASVDFGELVSEGNMALLRAVDKFDASRGFKFSTYACRAILKSFSRLALQQGRYRSRFPTEYDPSLEKSEWIDVRRGRKDADVLSDLRELLSSNLQGLDEIERTVIRERFALQPDATPKTLEEVGRIIGVTKERVRQIQNKSLRKLRDVLNGDVIAA